MSRRWKKAILTVSVLLSLECLSGPSSRLRLPPTRCLSPAFTGMPLGVVGEAHMFGRCCVPVLLSLECLSGETAKSGGQFDGVSVLLSLECLSGINVQVFLLCRFVSVLLSLECLSGKSRSLQTNSKIWSQSCFHWNASRGQSAGTGHGVLQCLSPAFTGMPLGAEATLPTLQAEKSQSCFHWNASRGWLLQPRHQCE